MTDATSEPAADWAHFFHRPPSGLHVIPTSVPADSTVVTTAPAPANYVGAITRPAVKTQPRKRSRASRRAPTTLLNTDAANFRAMVQQFTGVPTGPINTDRFVFGYGSDNSTRQAPAAMPLQQRQYYEYRPPPQPLQQDVMHMGYGMDDGQVMPGFLIDDMGHGYTFNG